MSRRRIVVTVFIAIPICLIVGGVVFLRSDYLLERIRGTIETRLGQLFEQPLLFSAAYTDSHALALDNGRLPEALRTAFADNGIEFSPALSVSPQINPGSGLSPTRTKNGGT